MTLRKEIEQMGDRARAASLELAALTTRRKNNILESIAEELEDRRSTVLEANREDMTKAREAGLSGAMLERLKLTDGGIDAMIKGIRNVVGLKDPVGQRIARWIRPNGLVIQKTRVPIGVIGIIYESRPNVTVDATVLCLKTSNAVILRGGREALNSNRALAEALQQGGERKGLPPHSIQLIETLDRKAVTELCRLQGRVDLIIPRGGEGLIRTVSENALVPVIKHYKGVCNLYVDQEADLDMALTIAENAKCQRPGVCNAIEALLVHEEIAATFLPRLAERLTERGVELRGDERTREIIDNAEPAREQDWGYEFLDMILAVKIVPNVDTAIDYINHYGSHHSDAIVSSDEKAQRAFLRAVDSSTVYVNASTRFTDGGEFGMGAEIGISTDKLHARGPMGLEELTTYKYLVTGDGQIRQ